MIGSREVGRKDRETQGWLAKISRGNHKELHATITRKRLQLMRMPRGTGYIAKEQDLSVNMATNNIAPFPLFQYLPQFVEKSNFPLCKVSLLITLRYMEFKMLLFIFFLFLFSAYYLFNFDTRSVVHISVMIIWTFPLSHSTGRFSLDGSQFSKSL